MLRSTNVKLPKPHVVRVSLAQGSVVDYSMILKRIFRVFGWNFRGHFWIDVSVHHLVQALEKYWNVIVHSWNIGFVLSSQGFLEIVNRHPSDVSDLGRS